jgi:hypothetical protein
MFDIFDFDEKFNVENGLCGIDRDCWQNIVFEMSSLSPIRIVY